VQPTPKGFEACAAETVGDVGLILIRSKAWSKIEEKEL
jgi:hypothetical protein